VAEESTPQSGSSGAPTKTAATPAEATKDSPWVNTLGMPFVPIPRFETRFCIWPVRVQDYEAYCMASGAKFPEIPFAQESDHPIVGVSWNDAIEFCVWLTGKERAEGKIDEKTVYRLPTDLEWSAAVGLPHEPEPTPAARHLKAPGYPWGLRWPPPRNAGNYEDRRVDQLGFAEIADNIEQGVRSDMDFANLDTNDWRIRGWEQTVSEYRRVERAWAAAWKPVDEFEFTSPVTSFAPNGFGLHDLGGNVWEWCMDNAAEQNHKILRGAAFAYSPASSVIGHNKIQIGYIGNSEQVEWFPIENTLVYRSSFRHCKALNEALSRNRLPCSGIRAVIATC
jgi:formylglycine-generating enzyme required for sulfatase activity